MGEEKHKELINKQIKENIINAIRIISYI